MNNIVSYCLNKLFGLSPDLTQSRLYDDDSFYPQFKKDLNRCREEVIIESPFISAKRMRTLSYLFENLVNRKVKVYVVTRDPEEHSINMKQQAEETIRDFERMGVQVIISDCNHRKLAILDRQVLWEGSLNILSQTHSHEIMRRISSETKAKECFKFFNMRRYIY
ncbi:MAG: hypothetical protein EOM23_06630 [Candidatus Moranbacteria bacterium]|nr:hypothetical protein [Candidatus Moranbacteria bacterium]